MKGANLRIAIRADASARIGSGHVMRCLALAEALRRRGCSVHFVAANIIPGLAERCVAEGHAFVAIAPPELNAQGTDWDQTIWPANRQRQDADRTATAVGTVDWLILDHYQLDRHWTERARGFAARILVIDDLANRTHDCDQLVDQTLGRDAADYRPLTSPGCRILAGPLYALLRPEFAEARTRALARRAKEHAARLLISLGSTDVGGVTGPVARAAARHGWERIDVILGSDDAPSLPELNALAAVDPRVAVHLAPANLVALLIGADVAIGAGGTSAWERSCLALPAITLILASNQQLVATSLEEVGAAIGAFTADQASDAANALRAAPIARQRMIAAAAALVDGLGAERVAGAMFAGAVPSAAIYVRPATARDAEHLWLWRNDPVTRAMSKNHEPIRWQDHLAWLSPRLTRDSGLLLIGELGRKPAGTVRFDPGAQDGFWVSINIAPDHRGRSLGAALLAAACDTFYREHGPQPLHAEIRPDNVASERIFTTLGFVRTDVMHENYACWSKAPPAL